MKHSLRMIVAGVLVIIIGVAVWLLFFSPKQDLSSYNKVLSTLDHTEKLNLYSDLETLRINTGHGENYENTFHAQRHAEIIKTRKKLFGNTSTLDLIIEDTNQFYSYLFYDTMLTETLEQYLAYLRIAKSATREQQNRIDSLCESYLKNLNNLSKLISDVSKYQKNYVVPSGQTDNGVANTNLTNSYNNLRVQYRECLLSKTELIMFVREFVIKYSFSGDFNDIPLTILYDSFTMAVVQAMEMPKESENSYLHDATLIAKKFETFRNGGNIFTFVTQNQFVNSYRNLYKNYYEGLEFTFSMSHNAKVEVVNNDDFANSAIREEYRADVKNLLTVYGINV